MRRAVILRALLAGSALVSVLNVSTAGIAAADSCAPMGAENAAECRHANAGTVVSRPVQPNVADQPAGSLGPLGFSISVESGNAAEVAPRTVAGAPARPDPLRQADRQLGEAGAQLSYDGLGARPRLAVSTTDLSRTAAPGQQVSFRAASNYASWIARAEVVVLDSRGKTVAVLPIAANGQTSWTVPKDAPREMRYLLRAYDSKGRFDETRSLPLSLGSGPLRPDLSGQVILKRRSAKIGASSALWVLWSRRAINPRSAMGAISRPASAIHGVRLITTG